MFPSPQHSGSRCIARAPLLLLLLALDATSSHAQDPLKLLPENYKLIFENTDVAVIRAHYGPHERIPVHDHTAFATVFVYLDDSGPVRIDHAEAGEKPSSVTRPPTVKGAYRVAPGIAERHSIENLGETSSDFLRVEMRRVTLSLKQPFRGRAPDSLAASQDAIEFTDSAVSIERIICTGPASCPVEPSPAPSLLIAFSPASTSADSSGPERHLEAGGVQWLPPSHGARVTPATASPAHLLRILLPSAPK